jgi:hypothetical protein
MLQGLVGRGGAPSSHRTVQAAGAGAGADQPGELGQGLFGVRSELSS